MHLSAKRCITPRCHVPSRKPKRLPQIPPDEELRRVVEAADRERDRLILLCMYLVGLRVSEVCGLEASDLDFRRRTLFVRQGKGAKDAVLPIPRHLHGPLRGWLRGRKIGPLFPSPRGGGLKKRAVQYLVKRCAVRAGLDPAAFHAHTFRHGCAGNMMRAGVPLPIIQRVLRHQNLATTSIYCDVFPEDLRAAIDG